MASACGPMPYISTTKKMRKKTFNEFHNGIKILHIRSKEGRGRHTTIFINGVKNKGQTILAMKDNLIRLLDAHRR